MTHLVFLGLLILLLLGSAAFSGSETAFYSLSRLRVRAEARQGSLVASGLELLLRHPAGFLITLLVGNNLCLELLTHLTDAELEALAVPDWGGELLVTLILTPVVFFFAELLPKDLFRRRPRLALGLLLGPHLIVRVLFLPLVLPLQVFSLVLERLLGVRAEDLERALARDRVREALEEGTRSGALEPRAEELALNVLEFRHTTLDKLLVPWERVETLDLERPVQELRAQLAASSYSRLPCLAAPPEGAQGDRPVVAGYLFLLDALHAALDPAGEPSPHTLLRPLPAMPPELTADQALASLRTGGHRMALVGTPEAPLGLVTLKDLVQTISGDLGGW